MLPSPTGAEGSPQKERTDGSPLLTGRMDEGNTLLWCMVILKAALLLLFMNHCGSLRLQVER